MLTRSIKVSCFPPCGKPVLTSEASSGVCAFLPAGRCSCTKDKFVMVVAPALRGVYPAKRGSGLLAKVPAPIAIGVPGACIFSTIAILIACMGLFGLAAFFSEKRTKEIGIRKVNGGTVIEIMSMLNRDFVKWVFIAFIISTPVAWYAMNKWLQAFAYKTEMSWWIFGLSGILALIIAIMTVSWQSWMAATRNPVEALRYE